MGIVNTQRGRLAPAVILVVLMALAVIVTLGLVASPAKAQSTFTTCASCHSSTAHSSNSTHAGLFSANNCSACHVNGLSAAGLAPSACAACHGGTAAILAKPTHTTNACGTTPGCHGYTSPTPTPTPTPTATAVKTTMTLKASPTIVKVRRSVKFSGVVGPLSALAGAKVAIKVERKVRTKWVKMKTATKTVSAAGKFSWSYKTAKKGAHRVTASIAKKANVYTAKKLVKSFRVK